MDDRAPHRSRLAGRALRFNGAWAPPARHARHSGRAGTSRSKGT
jgi:hypothetical protein